MTDTSKRDELAKEYADKNDGTWARNNRAFKAGYDEGERAGFQKAIETLRAESQNRARSGKYWADWLESQMPQHPKEHTLTNQHGEEVKMRFE